MLLAGNAKRCELVGFVDEEVSVGVEHVLLVSGLREAAEGAGSGEPRGELTCTVTGPGAEQRVPVEINVDEEGSCAELKLTPLLEGPLHCRIQFGGQLIPGGEFDLMVLAAAAHTSSLHLHPTCTHTVQY